MTRTLMRTAVAALVAGMSFVATPASAVTTIYQYDFIALFDSNAPVRQVFGTFTINQQDDSRRRGAVDTISVTIGDEIFTESNASGARFISIFDGDQIARAGGEVADGDGYGTLALGLTDFSLIINETDPSTSSLDYRFKDREDIFSALAGDGSLSFSIRQISGAVPEPATWAMMIAGFTLVAGAVRRRHLAPSRGRPALAVG